ncbi:MAG: hypothetical protein AB1938_23910 [Myxococcota bacterium]
MEQPVTVTIEDSQRTPTSLTVQVTPLSVRARLGRGLKALGVLWLASVASIVLPGLHFVLVPGFFLAGLVFFVLRVKGTVRLEVASFACPKCSSPVPIEEGTSGWPASCACPDCCARLVLTPEDAGRPRRVDSTPEFTWVEHGSRRTLAGDREARRERAGGPVTDERRRDPVNGPARHAPLR